jgi:hypothetical protein
MVENIEINIGEELTGLIANQQATQFSKPRSQSDGINKPPPTK